METGVEYINPKNAGPAQGLYTHVSKVGAGHTYYIAGQLAVAKDGSVVGKGDFEAQFKQVFSNMATVLSDLGLTFDHIAKFTTYFVHSQDIEKFMALRAEYFPRYFKTEKFAPNTICVLDRLVKEDFLFEVEAIAHAA